MDAGPPSGVRREPAPHQPPDAVAAVGRLGAVGPGTAGGRAASALADGLTDGARVASAAAAKALVLNASMEPLCVVPARRALVMVWSSKADVVHANGHRFRSERLDLPGPSVVRLRRYVHVPYRRRAALSRRGVFIRDDHTCQYCGRPAENVDHVVPRSRGGAHEWENVVAACRHCNGRKKDRTPGEARMSLARAPYAPRATFWLIVAVGHVHPEWRLYLGEALSAG